jgi:hypothetical protein
MNSPSWHGKPARRATGVRLAATWAFWSLNVSPRNFAIALPLQLGRTLMQCGRSRQSRMADSGVS